MENINFNQTDPEKTPPEDVTNLDMEKISTDLSLESEDGLPDFEQTTQSGLEQIKALQSEVNILIVNIQTMLNRQDYENDQLPDLLSKAQNLTQQVLPDALTNYQHHEMRLAGPELSRPQKALLMLLGVLRGGRALDTLTRSVESAAKRKQILTDMEDLHASAYALELHIDEMKQELLAQTPEGRDARISNLEILVSTARSTRINTSERLQEIPAILQPWFAKQYKTTKPATAADVYPNIKAFNREVVFKKDLSTIEDQAKEEIKRLKSKKEAKGAKN